VLELEQDYEPKSNGGIPEQKRPESQAAAGHSRTRYEEIWLLGQPPLSRYLEFVTDDVVGGAVALEAELVELLCGGATQLLRGRRPTDRLVATTREARSELRALDVRARGELRFVADAGAEVVAVGRRDRTFARAASLDDDVGAFAFGAAAVDAACAFAAVYAACAFAAVDAACAFAFDAAAFVVCVRALRRAGARDGEHEGRDEGRAEHAWIVGATGDSGD